MSYTVKVPVLHAPRRAAVAFGDDEIPDAEWKRRMLAAQEGFVVEAKRYREQDHKAKTIQIIATLSIPLAAAIWRLILRHRGEATG